MALTWSRAHRRATLLLNGDVARQLVVDNNPDLDLRSSGHSVYEIGLMRSTGDTSHAYFSDLVIFNRELSESELEDELFRNHPLNQY